MISPPQSISCEDPLDNYFLICVRNFVLSIIIISFICWIPFLICIYFMMIIPCIIYEYALSPFFSYLNVFPPLPPMPFPSPFCVWRREFEQQGQIKTGKKVECVRNRLRKQLSLSSRIEILKVRGVNLYSFDALCHCLPQVKIGRLEIDLVDYYPNYNGLSYTFVFE